VLKVSPKRKVIRSRDKSGEHTALTLHLSFCTALAADSASVAFLPHFSWGFWQYRTKPAEWWRNKVETGWRASLVNGGAVGLPPKGESDRITTGKGRRHP
jgi:hypothetical protein